MDNQSDPTDSTYFKMRNFNPGLLQSDEQIASQFVIREHQFRIVREVINQNIGSPSCQHILVVGSRGQGKTMLLNRVASEIRVSEEFSGYYLPLQFMEENHEINNLGEFWLEILFQLAQEVAATDAQFSSDLMATHDSLLSRWTEQLFEEIARAAALNAAKRLGRRLVILVENAQVLFRLPEDDFDWKLRAVLQTVPEITLVATTTYQLDENFDPGAAFYQFFRMVELNPLNTEECGRLWSSINKTPMSGNEIRPLQVLTGGNPRLIAYLASIENHHSQNQLMEELVLLVDEQTAHFHSQLEALPPQERRVFVALLDLWEPSNTSAITHRARMDIRIVSTMLIRLSKRGIVHVDSRGGPRKRLYYASERLFSIFYKLRRVKDNADSIRSLIHFMELFYGARQDRNMYQAASPDMLKVPLLSESLRKGELVAETHQDIEDSIAYLRDYLDKHTDSENQQALTQHTLIIMKQALNYGVFGDFDQELGHFEKVIESLRNEHASEDKTICFYAWLYRSRRLAELGRANESLESCDQLLQWLESNSDIPSDGKNMGCNWHMNCTKALALTYARKLDEALDAFKNAYDAFDRERDADLIQMLRLVSELIAAGAKEQDLIKVFESNEKVRDLSPLLTTLKQRVETTVNVPIEIAEVAQDIQNSIEHRLTDGIQPGYRLAMVHP